MLSQLAIEHPSVVLRSALDAVGNYWTAADAIFDPLGLHDCIDRVFLEVGDLVSSFSNFNHPFAPEDFGFDGGLGKVALEFSD